MAGRSSADRSGGHKHSRALLCCASAEGAAVAYPVAGDFGCFLLCEGAQAQPDQSGNASQQSCWMDAEHPRSPATCLLDIVYGWCTQASAARCCTTSGTKGPGFFSSRYQRYSGNSGAAALLAHTGFNGEAESSAADFLSRLLVTVLQPRVTRCGETARRFQDRGRTARCHQR